MDFDFESESEEIIKGECEHINTINESGEKFCIDCGETIDEIVFKKDWNNYEDSRNKTRCIQRNINEASIKSVFDEYNIVLSPAIVNSVNEKYKSIMQKLKERDNKKKNVVMRGKGRVSLTAVCLKFIYHSFDEIIFPEDLCKMFKLTKRDLSKSIALYTSLFPEDIYEINVSNIVPTIIKKLDIHPDKTQEIISFVEDIRNSSYMLLSGVIHSICCCIVFVWILYRNYPITKDEFISKIGISNITLNKNLKDIKKTLKNIL